jgi:DNA-binding response OmpR family regulator
LVLLDFEMESPRDFELTRRLRSGEKKNVHTPIYVLFNPSGLVDRESCRSAGLDGFLAKPIETDAVLNVVAAIAIRGKPAETRAQKGVQVTQGKGRASLRLAVRGMKAIPASFGHAIGPS